MSLDENNYKTLRFMKCKTCGNVFAASLAGSKECPDCASNHIAHFRPDENNDPENDAPPVA